MSELENKSEAPKRKRRTKAEIEAARAAGELPAKRTRKKGEEAPKLEEQEPKEETYKKPVPPREQSVLIMACLHPKVAQIATSAAKENGVDVVILEDKVIDDYLDAKGETANKNNLSNFLSDATNRIQSERNAKQVWLILAGSTPIEQAEHTIFTRTQLCKATKLSHQKASTALNALQIFGLLEFTKGDYEFRLVFNKKAQRDTIKTDVLSMCKILNNDILRYKASIDSDDSLTKEEKDELYRKLQADIDGTIEY